MSHIDQDLQAQVIRSDELHLNARPCPYLTEVRGSAIRPLRLACSAELPDMTAFCVCMVLSILKEAWSYERYALISVMCSTTEFAYVVEV